MITSSAVVKKNRIEKYKLLEISDVFRDKFVSNLEATDPT